jgi:hypothetical protein
MKILRVLLPALWILATAPLAAADPTAALAGKPSNKQEALQRYKDGVARIEEGEFELARLAFLQAYTLDPAPQLLWNLGISEAKSQHFVDALRHLRAYLKLPDVTAKQRAVAQPLIEAAARGTGHIAVVVDAGTDIRLDGNLVARPLVDVLDVAPGSHVVTAQQGSRSKTVTASPGPGETASVDLRFPAAESEPNPVPVPPATSAREVPTVSPSPSAMPDATPLPTHGSGTTRVIVMAGLGIASVGSLIAGVTMWVDAKSKADEASGALGNVPNTPSACAGSSSSACIQAHNAVQTEASDKSAANWLFVGAGVLAGTSLASWFLLAPKRDQARVGELVPELSPTSAALRLQGTF